jgi:adenylate cyclase
MAEQRAQRRLAAILAADVVGYSRLMRADEAGTLAQLNAVRKELLDPKIAEYGGRIVKTTGDGILIEFPSAVDGVQHAVDVQQAMAKRNASVPAGRRMEIRMGINVGDVIVEDNDLFGDGVNVAARLEEIADPGGICISGNAYEQVRDKLQAVFEDLGEQHVKNIDRPVRAYRVRLDIGDPTETTDSQNDTKPLPLPDKPSVAVLPFDNMSEDPEQEFFADGLAEDIIAILSKTSKLMVIARNSSFAYKGTATDIRQIAGDLGVRYILEGSVRKGGDRLRVTAQLIDAANGSHIWAERYDRRVEDIFDIQDNITKEIVTALRVQLTDGEDALTWNKGTQSIDAWRWALEAGELFFRFSPAEIASARDLCRRSLELEPNYAYAWALSGCCDWYLARIGPGENAEALIDQAEKSIAKSLDLDGALSWGHFSNGMVLLYRRQFDEAVSALQRAVALLPGDANVRAGLGFALIHAGRPGEGLQAMREAMRLNPHPPLWYRFLTGRGHDMLGDLELALTEFEYITRGISFTPYIHIASLLVRLGRVLEAKVALSEALSFNSQFNLAAVDRYLMCRDGEYVKAVTESLREAGLPE